MSKRIIFEERAKQEVIKSYMETFERLCRSEAGRLPDEIFITMRMRARWASSFLETDAGVVILKPIYYATPGRLSGEVEGHDISVSNDGEGCFRALINGKLHHPLSSRLVEEELKVEVHRKKSGSQVGYPQESVPRAVWRHLMQQYNSGDPTVHYERPKE